MQVGVLEDVAEEAGKIAGLVEQADSRPVATSCTEKAEELISGV